MKEIEANFSIIGDVAKTKRYKALLREANVRPYQGVAESASFLGERILKIHEDVEDYIKGLLVAFYPGRELHKCESHSQALVSKEYPIVLTIISPAILLNDIPSDEVLTYLSEYDCGAVILDIKSNQVVWPLH